MLTVSTSAELGGACMGGIPNSQAALSGRDHQIELVAPGKCCFSELSSGFTSTATSMQLLALNKSISKCSEKCKRVAPTGASGIGFGMSCS